MASFLQIQISGMTINGRRLPDVNYTRTEHADGTVTETGTPPAGLAPGATLDQVIAAAADGGQSTVTQPGGRRLTRPTRPGLKHVSASGTNTTSTKDRR